MKRSVPFMVNALAVVVLAALLVGCAPRSAQVGEPSMQPSSTWTQSTASDFKKGTLQRIQVQREADGELTLAQTAEGSYEPSGVYTSPPFSPPQPFSAAVWQWEASVPDGATLILSIRTSLGGEDWTEWQDVAPDPDLRSEDTDWPGHVWVVAEARTLQYRLQFASADGLATPVVASVAWTFTDTRPGPSVQEAMQMVVPQSEGPGVPRPAIIPRRGWGANESLMTWEPEYVKPVKIIIHHTATPNDLKQDPAATVRAVYYYHAVTRGWGDIGYNYLIDPLGNIYEGRKGGESVVGGHDFGFNEGSVGISLIGDFQAATPTDAMMASLARLVAWVCDRYQIDPMARSVFRDVDLPNISGHRETKATTCPGDQVQNRLPTLREQVRDTIQQEAPSVRFVSPAATDVLSGTQVVKVQGGVETSDITLYLDGKPVVRKLAASLEYRWETADAADGDHQLKAIAHNARGEEAEQVILVLVDNTLPHATLLLPGIQEYATQKAITLTLEAFDVGSGLKSMQVARGEDPTDAPIQPYQREIPIVMEDQTGHQVFSARVMDKAGLISTVSVLDLFYDPNPPGGWTEPALSNTGEIAVRVRDDESGLDPASAFAMTSPDGGITWSDWIDVSVTPEGAEAALFTRVPDFTTLIRFEIADRAGNLAQSPVYLTPCDGCAPEATPTPAPQPTLTAPDLVVAGLEVFPPKPETGEPTLFRAKIRNQGDGAAGGFWVQLYLDPKVTPYVNSVASQLGVGLFWYVDGLTPGEEITLISSEPYPLHGNYPGHLASGMHSVYVLVDAYHTEGETGLVLESDESNNLLGPISLETTGSSPFSWSSLEEWLSHWLNWKP
jgi:hypothetical protein